MPPFAPRPSAHSAHCQPQRILSSQYLRIAFTWISESREVRPHTLSDTTFVGQISRKKRSRPIFSTERYKHDRESDFFLEIQVRTRSGHGNRGRTRVVRSDCPARLPTLQGPVTQKLPLYTASFTTTLIQAAQSSKTTTIITRIISHASREPDPRTLLKSLTGQHHELQKYAVSIILLATMGETLRTWQN